MVTLPLNQKTASSDFSVPGDVVMIGFFGREPAPDLEAVILEKKVGGIILFGRNIVSVSQTRELIGRLQEIRSRVSPDPLLIAVDQEGGAVNRFVEGVSVFPGNRALGEAGNRDWAYREGLTIGRQLRDIGVNVNLAPVLDLYELPGNPSTGIRSLGSDPDLAADLGAALVRGFLEGGVVPVAKHFPGKGAARVDSHLGLPVIDRGRTLLEARELKPFRAAFAAGLPAVMVSHAAYPGLEKEKAVVPATFSSRVQRELLRDRLGFQGAAVTDDLGMGAVRGSVASVVRRAVGAGSDLLLLCHSSPAQAEALASLARAADEPELGERLREAGARVAGLRRLAARPVSFSGPGDEALPRTIAAAAVRCFRDPGGLIPIDVSRKLAVVRFLPRAGGGAEERPGSRGADLAEALSARGMDVRSLNFDTEPSPAAARRIESASGGRLVVVCAYDAYRFPRQRALLAKLPRAGTVAVAVRDPRDVDLFPRDWTAFATYGHTVASMEALADALWGRLPEYRG